MGNIGRGLGWAKPSPSQQLEEDLGVAPGHVGVGLALRRGVAEIAPAVDHLLGRAAADAELQAPAGDEVGGARVLGHVERVLVAHVDDGRADLDAAGLGADRRQQRERRGELAGEVVHPEIGAVRAELLRGDGEIDGLQQRVRAERVCDCGEGDQWPNERKPIFFFAGMTGLRGAGTGSDPWPRRFRELSTAGARGLTPGGI